MTRKIIYYPLCCALWGFILFPNPTFAQGSVERIVVHSTALEGNLSGDAPDREVSVYLPPAYHVQPERRFPVVYFLHGYTDSDDRWFGLVDHWINLPITLDEAFASAALAEVIVVMPNAYTRFKGSMYSNSVTTGDWETFIAEELVAHIDSTYRTLAQPQSRGLTGHSMGGYGAMRIGMQHPDVFTAVYLMSPCCMAPSETFPLGVLEMLRDIETPGDIDALGFFPSAVLASAAAWAPNPTNPPLYLDLPPEEGDDRLAANATLVMLHQHISQIKQLKALSFDVGAQDMGIAETCKTLDNVLTNYDIPHGYEVYEGNHINRIAERIQEFVLPFFSEHLVAE